MRKAIKELVDDCTINGKVGFSGYVILGWMTFALIVMSPIWLPFAAMGWVLKRISEKL